MEILRKIVDKSFIIVCSDGEKITEKSLSFGHSVVRSTKIDRSRVMIRCEMLLLRFGQSRSGDKIDDSRSFLE